MLGHEEAVALLLHKVHAPVFPVQVQHIGLVGLIKEVHVGALEYLHRQLVPYLGAVLVLCARPEHHRLVFPKVTVIREEFIVQAACAVFASCDHVKALLGAASAECACNGYANVLVKHPLPVCVKQLKACGPFPFVAVFKVVGGDYCLAVGQGWVVFLAVGVYAFLIIPQVIRVCYQGHHRKAVVYIVRGKKVCAGCCVSRKAAVLKGSRPHHGVFAHLYG